MKKTICKLSLYLIIGVLTTLINIIMYWLCTRMLHMTVMLSTAIAWLIAVLFAFVGNKWIVFNSRLLDKKTVITELLSFISCRLATGGIDVVAMLLFVELLGFPDVVMKIIANGLIIVGNFIASNYFVFKKREKI